jgi:hypothetical protein
MGDTDKRLVAPCHDGEEAARGFLPGEGADGGICRSNQACTTGLYFSNGGSAGTGASSSSCGGECARAYADSREVRLFDEQRYTHSLRLPEVIRSIGDRRCFHTGHDNFFTVELIDAQDKRVEYTVQLSRAPSKGRLNLYVQSAYVQDDIPQRRPKPRKPIRFSVIAYNVAVGKAIKVPK